MIEVNLAILVVTFGALILFSLFPAGMKEGENAVVETHVSMFGDFILSGMEANAEEITSWNTWSNENAFQTAAVSNLITPGNDQIVANGRVQGPIVFSGKHLRYIIETSLDGSLRLATVWVLSGEHGTTNEFRERSKYYHSEFYYPGVL